MAHIYGFKNSVQQFLLDQPEDREFKPRLEIWVFIVQMRNDSRFTVKENVVIKPAQICEAIPSAKFPIYTGPVCELLFQAISF